MNWRLWLYFTNNASKHSFVSKAQLTFSLKVNILTDVTFTLNSKVQSPYLQYIIAPEARHFRVPLNERVRGNLNITKLYRMLKAHLSIFRVLTLYVLTENSINLLKYRTNEATTDSVY